MVNAGLAAAAAATDGTCVVVERGKKDGRCRRMDEDNVVQDDADDSQPLLVVNQNDMARMRYVLEADGIVSANNGTVAQGLYKFLGVNTGCNSWEAWLGAVQMFLIVWELHS